MTTVSDYFREQMFKERTAEVVVLLVTVSHPQMTEKRRFSSDPTVRLPANAEMEVRYGTISRGMEFDFLPMEEISLPDDAPDQNSVINMVLKNISGAITPLLLQTVTPADVTIEVVLASRPDLVEMDYDFFKLKSADVDAGQVTLGLSVDALMSEPFPADEFTPSGFPGLWART